MRLLNGSHVEHTLKSADNLAEALDRQDPLREDEVQRTADFCRPGK